MSRHRPLLVALLGSFILLLLIAPGSRAQTPPTSSVTLYNDALAPGWVNWSWDGRASFTVSNPVYSGTRAISFTAKKRWGGFYLHTNTAVPTTSSTVLHFALRASQAGQVYGVVLFSTTDQILGEEVLLANAGGNPVAGVWRVYDIPLNAFGVAGQSIGGIAIQDEAGKVEPVLYIDDIRLLTAAGDTTPPTAPANFQAAARDGGSISATWQASTDNAGVTGYRLYVGSTMVAATTATNYIFTGLVCGSSYSVGARAIDAAGNLSPMSAMQVSLVCPPPGAIPAVPVLLYHEIDTGSSISVTSANFDAQMNYLKQQGYNTINTQQYAAWHANRNYPLPPKPILITFDDGQSSTVKATPILQKYGFKATMFVVTGFANNINGRFGTYYLSWTQLHQLDSTGVWEWAFHAGEHGHDYYNQYSCSFFYPCVFPGETFDQYEIRVETDLDQGTAKLGQEFPDWAEFAVPWSDYGQFNPDGRVKAFLLDAFRSRFQVVFVLSPSDQVHAKLRYRFNVEPTTTVSQLASALSNPAFK